MHYSLIFTLLLGLFYNLHAQPTIPIELLTQGDTYKATFDFAGTGSFVENLDADQFNGKGEISANLWLKPVMVSFRYNPISFHRITPADSFRVSKFALNNDDYLIYCYGAFKKIHPKQPNLHHNIFSCFSLTKINIENGATISLHSAESPIWEFDVFKYEVGYHADMILNTNKEQSANNLVLSFAIKGNYTKIQAPLNIPMALEDMHPFRKKKDVPLAKNYFGWGIKGTFYLNHLSFYFETQSNIGKRNEATNIPYFTGRMFYTVGIAVTGSALLFKNG